MIKKKYLSLLAALTAIMLVVTGCGSDSEPTSGKTTKNSETEVSSTITPDDKESDNSESETDDTDSESETDDTDSETDDTESETDDTANNDTRPSEEDIMRICSTYATCETNIDECYIDITSNNPYNINYNYGEEYNELIAMCDWSLVWNYDFYIEYYPEIAELYHYDKELLLKYFQTVGVHEGHKGSSNFDPIRTAINNNIRYGEFGGKYSTLYNLESENWGVAHIYFLYMLYPENYTAKTKGDDEKVYKPCYTSLDREVLFKTNYDGYFKQIQYVVNLAAYNYAKNDITDDVWIDNLKNNNELIINNLKRDGYDVIVSYMSSDNKPTLDELSTNINKMSNIPEITPHTYVSNIYHNPNNNKYYYICINY